MSRFDLAKADESNVTSISTRLEPLDLLSESVRSSVSAPSNLLWAAIERVGGRLRVSLEASIESGNESQSDRKQRQTRVG